MVIIQSSDLRIENRPRRQDLFDLRDLHDVGLVVGRVLAIEPKGDPEQSKVVLGEVLDRWLFVHLASFRRGVRSLYNP